MAMNPDRKTQIKGQSGAQSGIQSWAQVGALIFYKAPTEVPVEYFNYSNDFSAENAVELPKITGINEHIIKLEEGKHSLFESINSLSLVELETLKTYIKINVTNGFMRPSKSTVETPILFNWKPDGSFCFCMNH